VRQKLMLGVEPVLCVMAGLAAAAFIDLECALADLVVRHADFRRCDLLAGEVLAFDGFGTLETTIGNSTTIKS